VYLGGIEEADLVQQNHALLHVRLPGSKPGYLLDHNRRISISMSSEWNQNTLTVLNRVLVKVSRDPPEVATVDLRSPEGLYLERHVAATLCI